MTMPPGQRYGAGPTTYSNGTHHPTDGTVDPSGYITRELNKMTQPSQSRSGLAAAALQRLGSKNGNSGNSGNNQSSAIGDYSDPSLTPATLRPLSSVGDFTINAIGQLVPVPPAPAMPVVPQTPIGGLQGEGSPPIGQPDPSILAQAAMARLGGQ